MALLPHCCLVADIHFCGSHSQTDQLAGYNHESGHASCFWYCPQGTDQQRGFFHADVTTLRHLLRYNSLLSLPDLPLIYDCPQSPGQPQTLRPLS